MSRNVGSRCTDVCTSAIVLCARLHVCVCLCLWVCKVCVCVQCLCPRVLTLTSPLTY